MPADVTQLSKVSMMIHAVAEKEMIMPCDFLQLKWFVSDELLRLNEIGRCHLSPDDNRYFEMLQGVHINIAGVMKDVSEAIRNRLNDAAGEADWHLSIIEGVNLINKGK
ncbi:hypothetical protein GR173_004312 [Salmonella enterica subsp. enterica]|uniref:Uncharacterized protein n=1 Tax=Salmonella enterica subsp. enterica serovar Agbeni TaxID=1967642 RepID=A0A5X8MSF1_SALET|nr:hypothetical protein [Salmonella enterica subsp. enterica serovar Agbeni]EBU7767338.1 hypothetical protein [Salmonella enterica subsp. enterica serovar Rovaniemi]EDU0171266.1 hypothetical protein [Salmonella enterica subsp. enterica serovar Belfast]EFR2313542.1 hypothetical protein [Salmonella enterica]EIR2645999.1 hypothetical protein [Salmonella enterica subsp. enterica serovar Enteritidis]